LLSKTQEIAIQIAATAKIFNGKNVCYLNLNVFDCNIVYSSGTINKE